MNALDVLCAQLTRDLFAIAKFLLIMWRSSSSKSAAVYKISWKSDDFSLRYGDISIFKMAAVRHLGIVLPPFETTHKVSVLAAAACQISCQSDTQIWRYSYLNFSHIWLEMPIQAPKLGFLGDFGPINVIIHHRDTQKEHPCINSCLLNSDGRFAKNENDSIRFSTTNFMLFDKFAYFC